MRETMAGKLRVTLFRGNMVRAQQLFIGLGPPDDVASLDRSLKQLQLHEGPSSSRPRLTREVFDVMVAWAKWHCELSLADNLEAWLSQYIGQGLRVDYTQA
jgi:hypothetical protein